MSKSHLRPCPGCSRHVRVSDATCPFCGVALGASFGAAPVPVSPSVRLSRAALVAFGTGTLSLAAACGGALAGSSEPPGDAGKDTGTTSARDSGSEEQDSGIIIAPPYGAPPYGAFPVPDSGEGVVDSESTEPIDSGAEPTDATFDSTGIAPPYGGVPGH